MRLEMNRMRRAFVLLLLVLGEIGCLGPPSPPTAPAEATVARQVALPTATAVPPTRPPASATIPPLPAADPASGLDDVRLAYGLLLDKFVHPLSPRTLLAAAW